MSTIIESISQQLALPEEKVRQAVATVYQFIREQVGPDLAARLEASLPEVKDIATDLASQATGTASGALNQLLSRVGTLPGAGMAGAAAALAALQKIGIPTEKAIPLAKAVIEQLQATLDPALLESILEKLPALRALVGNNRP